MTILIEKEYFSSSFYNLWTEVYPSALFAPGHHFFRAAFTFKQAKTHLIDTIYQ
jgi:hypothetical protein